MEESEKQAMLLQLAALKAASRSGVLTVRHGDTSTTFRSLAEIERALAAMEAELNPRAPRRGPRYITQLSKGL
ncbi:MAG: hypothetical protein JWM84_4024 [Nocardioides sp.]|nr:hypothetical protein [Nocardioides sp.]